MRDWKWLDGLSSMRLLLPGFVLVVIGAALPFAMVIGLLESTFLLNFVAAFSSVIGLFLGIIGAAALYKRERRDGDD